MKLAGHIRQLILSGYPREMLKHPRLVRQILYQKGVTGPSVNQVRRAIKTHQWYVLGFANLLEVVRRFDFSEEF